MNVADIEYLLAADDDAPAEHLKQLMHWHFERAMTSARLSFGAAASLLAALLAALFGSKTHLSIAEGVLVGIGIIVATAFGAYRLNRTKAIHEDYVAALRLLREMAPLTPLLRLYQE
jgi:ABC-type glycerol-3-phosphate transport system permease component